MRAFGRRGMLSFRSRGERAVRQSGGNLNWWDIPPESPRFSVTVICPFRFLDYPKSPSALVLHPNRSVSIPIW